MEFYVRHPDSPREQRFVLAGEEITRGIQRRFENRPVVHHPSEKDLFIYDPGNFWDGPTHVTWEPDTGHFTFVGWHGREHFPMIGPLR